MGLSPAGAGELTTPASVLVLSSKEGGYANIETPILVISAI